ncbi:MAG: C-terminal binding protein [Clostridia bacterium]|jgi:D-3-phosphoglycerate dehydrogenase / 2-oxoglutarate reductase|nr:C-terminal binding protein [Clostridia bacterium]MBT7122467.1 C-terminal binding protein [Clostridia bacterium]
MNKVVLTDHLNKELALIRQILKETDTELIAEDCGTEDETIDAAKDADVLMTANPRFYTPKMIGSLNKCKAVVIMSIGYDGMDIDALTKNGIMLINVPDYCLNEVADHALALLLGMHRKVSASDAKLREQLEYRPYQLRPIKGLSDTTVGIYGFGRIARRSAKRLSAFGCTIQFFDPYVDSDYDEDGVHAKKVSFEQMLRTSDDILMHAPATKENYHIFNDDAFALCERKPYVINVGRGEVMDENALCRAVTSGKVSGAALDVHEYFNDFKADDAIFNTPNIVLTPHCAWYSETSLNNMARTVAEEINRVMRGQMPLSVVNKKELGL